MEPPAFLKAKWARYTLPGVGAALTFIAFSVLGPFKGVPGMMVSALFGGFMGGAGIYLPKMFESRRGARIDDDLPFFITHFGILATSNLPRGELLRILSENQEYKEVAKEMRRILRLTQEWGLGVADAVRAVAETTPSKVFSALLLRLAHAMESGQNLDTFLLSEQSVVMRDYTSVYHSELLKVDNWKEMYTNSLMTVGFLVVFASVIPLVAGGNSFVMALGSAGLTAFLEIMLGVVLKERLPSDRLTPRRAEKTPLERQTVRTLQLSVGVGLAAGLVVWLLFGLGPALIAAAIPLIWPGLAASKMEKKIREREDDYPAFIRSVGAAAAARGGTLRDTLATVQANNLGALTVPVRDLHRRLVWRVDDTAAWKRFGEETGSRLIDTFTDMFVQGIACGGKPGPISQIVSDNMLQILALRTTRRANGGAFRGLLVGLTVGLGIVLFMGAGIFSSLTKNFAQFSDLLQQQGLFQIQSTADLDHARDLLLVLMAVHGIASGTFFKLVEGGRLEGAALHIMINVCAGVGTGLLVSWVLPGLMGAAIPAPSPP